MGTVGVSVCSSVECISNIRRPTVFWPPGKEEVSRIPGEEFPSINKKNFARHDRQRREGDKQREKT